MGRVSPPDSPARGGGGHNRTDNRRVEGEPRRLNQDSTEAKGSARIVDKITREKETKERETGQTWEDVFKRTKDLASTDKRLTSRGLRTSLWQSGRRRDRPSWAHPGSPNKCRLLL